ncbi:MAG: type II secretion pathway protein XcpW [Oceanospirillaceae bacterium]|nr:type II secretion pathway protein XcpW [Oceanospirillaceae bacterium]
MVLYPHRNARQRGLTLIELLLALALTSLLGVMLAAQIDLWVGLKTGTKLTDSRDAQVLDLCSALDNRFAALVERPLHTQGLALYNERLEWLPDQKRLEWVALNGPALGGLFAETDDQLATVPVRQYSALQRQALSWQQEGVLVLEVSADLDSPRATRWQPLIELTGVDQVQVEFRVEERWQSFPSDGRVATEAVRVLLMLDEQAPQVVPYRCTFTLPAQEV